MSLGVSETSNFFYFAEKLTNPTFNKYMLRREEVFGLKKDYLCRNNELLRLAASVSYNGSGFHGFAAQLPNIKTIAGVLQNAIFKRLRSATPLVCAGRTDKGVHAIGQVIHFDAECSELRAVDLKKLNDSINKELYPNVAIRDLSFVSNSFNARRSAIRRHYKYLISRSVCRNPLLSELHWWFGGSLDMDLMNLACERIIGEHDFSAFCKKVKGAEVASNSRNVYTAIWTESNCKNFMQLDILANAFCHQMVRSLVGMFVEIGRGRRRVSDMTEVLESLSRLNSAQPAPPQGLCLWNVEYRDINF